MFADYTHVFASHENADKGISIVNTELFKVVNWLTIYKLFLNVEKQIVFFFIPEKKLFKMW